MSSVSLTCLFILTFVFRYLRLLVNCIAFATHRSVPPVDQEASPCGAQNVTVVIPTLDGDSPQIRDTVRTILHNRPARIILVTVEKNHARALELARSLDEKHVTIFSNPHANKRLQMLKGLDAVTTEYVVFSDDDVFWKPRTLDWLMAPFRDPGVGGTGTCQRLRRAVSPTPCQQFWNFLAAVYLERRNFDCASCNAVDGGLPCLSGRTAMYRASILQESDFQHEFRNEKWRGTKLNHADDDNFLTRWLISHDWRIRLQYSAECEVETILADDRKFILQCFRWSRSNWRSNFTSLIDDRNVWWKHPWSTYAVFLPTLTAWSVPSDFLLLWLLLKATEDLPSGSRLLCFACYATWWLLARSIKLFGHFRRYPLDLCLLPVSIGFGYFHCLVVKTWALYTLHQTTWGSRTDADVDNDWRMASPPSYAADRFTNMPEKPRVDHRITLNTLPATQPLLCAEASKLYAGAYGSIHGASQGRSIVV